MPVKDDSLEFIISIFTIAAFWFQNC